MESDDSQSMFDATPARPDAADSFERQPHVAVPDVEQRVPFEYPQTESDLMARYPGIEIVHFEEEDDIVFYREGSYGRVYKIKYLGREGYAIKVPKVMPHHPQAMSQYRHEIALMERMRHPRLANIVAVLRPVERLPLVVMHFYQSDLHGYLKEQVPLGERTAFKLQCSLDIVEALVFLHANQIIHMDLKPYNVLVTDQERVVVSDFGLSLETVRGRMTEPYCDHHTYRYWHPSVYLEDRVSFQVDVYAWAVLTFEILELMGTRSRTRSVYDYYRGLPLDEWIDDENVLHFSPPAIRPLLRQCVSDPLELLPAAPQLMDAVLRVAVTTP